MTEQELMDKVVELARTVGWRVAHFRPARTQHGWRTACQYDAEGWPDLFLVHPDAGDKLAVELKVWARRNDVSDAQRHWLVDLEMCGIETALWTERDFDTEIVPRLLRPTNARRTA